MAIVENPGIEKFLALIKHITLRYSEHTVATIKVIFQSCISLPYIFWTFLFPLFCLSFGLLDNQPIFLTSLQWLFRPIFLKDLRDSLTSFVLLHQFARLKRSDSSQHNHLFFSWSRLHIFFDKCTILPGPIMRLFCLTLTFVMKEMTISSCSFLFLLPLDLNKSNFINLSFSVQFEIWLFDAKFIFLLSLHDKLKYIMGMSIIHFFFLPKNSILHHLDVWLSCCNLSPHGSSGYSTSSSLRNILVLTPRKSISLICLRMLCLKRKLASSLRLGWFCLQRFQCRRWRGTCLHCFLFWSFRACPRLRLYRSFVLQRWSHQQVRCWVDEEWEEWWLCRWRVYTLFCSNMQSCWRLF